VACREGRSDTLDLLLGNIDRHGGNAMLRQTGSRSWIAIDNGFSLLDNDSLARSFRELRTRSSTAMIRGFTRDAREKVQQVIDNEALVRSELKDRLTDTEIDSKFERASSFSHRSPTQTSTKSSETSLRG